MRLAQNLLGLAFRAAGLWLVFVTEEGLEETSFWVFAVAEDGGWEVDAAGSSVFGAVGDADVVWDVACCGLGASVLAIRNYESIE